MKNRIGYLDELKGFVIICVVLGHVLEGYIKSNFWIDYNNCMQVVFNLIYSFHMPLCFMLSGYFFRLAYYDENVKVKKTKLISHIFDFASVYVLFSFIFWLFKLLMADNVNDKIGITEILFIWRDPLQLYWYLYVLIELYVIAALVLSTKLSRHAVFVICVVLCVLSNIVDGGIWFEIRRLMYNCLFFFAGICIRETKEFLAFKKLWGLFVEILTGILLVFMLINNITINTAPIINAFIAFVLSVVLWRLFKRGQNNQHFVIIRGGVRTIGENMIIIYVTHVFFTASIRILLHKLELKNLIICVALNLALSVCIPVVSALILKKIKLHDYIFKPVSCLIKKKGNYN